MMVNIPTELLRTLISVVDLRSFTKAAQALGVTQPAVSAQIKRLQMLLGSEILDKSAPGVTLTPMGEMVVNHARRLLSINDHILGLATPQPPSQTIRIGVPGDFVSPHLPWTLAEFKNRWPDVCFTVRNGISEMLRDELRQGQLDLVIGLSATASIEARQQWPEESVWVRGPRIPFLHGERIPIVSFGDDCVFHRIAVEALQKEGRTHDTVYVSSSTTGLAAAVSAGLGVMAMARSRTGVPGLTVWEDAPLPKLPNVSCGIYIRDGGDRAALEQLADSVAETLHPLQHLAVADRKAPVVISF
ncbi:MAG TPA: LysR family transcriptional regulator [Pseudorhodoplanes sp.]|nr:LysR family transcriptional regulator [Pseudorhodoplanes sp.]